MCSDNEKHHVVKHKGNPFLAVGVIWGFVAVFVCPCPLCVFGTLSFLSAGLLDKTWLGRRLKAKIDAAAHEHDCGQACGNL